MKAKAALIPVSLCFLLMGCQRQPQKAKPHLAVPKGIELPAEYGARLRAAGWEEHVGKELGLWVSVAAQELAGIKDGRVVFACLCSTAAKGTGNRQDSNQTPLGWHAIAERFGDGLPLGAVFRERKHTGEVWTPDSPTKEDLILTRIMWLQGLERGVNAGKGIDSHARYIYIHGTPEEDMLGSPASMGCIRLSNEDVAAVFDQTATGTRVLITEW
jgi:hypothetical protein